MIEMYNVSLKDVLTFKNGKKRPKGSGNIPVYGGNGILGYTDKSNYENCIVVGRVGAYCGSVYYEPNQCWVSDNAICGTPHKNVDIYYTMYLLKSLHLNQRHIGTSQPLLTQEILNSIECKVPSFNIQKKISGILLSIDNKIENNNAINRNLSEQASAYYENWKMSLTGEAVELSKVIDVRDGTHASPKPQDEGYPLVTSKHLFEYDVDLESPNKISQDDYDKTNERSKVEYHDVLMSMIGTVGVVSFISRQEINFAIKNVALFRTSQREELAYYVLLFLKSKDTKQYIKSCMAGSTQQYISLTELRKIPIIVPGEEIKEFNLVIKPIIDMICANVIENRRLSELRDTLLPKLMSGELDVSDLDI